MKFFWVAVLAWLTCYLLIAPLPKAIKLPDFSLPSSGLNKKRNIKFNFEDQLQFLYCIKTQLLAGATQISALQFALTRIDESLLPETRRSISLRSDVYVAMNHDAIEFKFSALGNYGLLMQASAISGASISQSLSNLASSMIQNRTQEQLLSTELASTKATVLVLAGLPIIGSALAMMLGSQSIIWLVTTNVGRVVLASGLCLELLGLFWIKHLLKKALSDPA